MTHTGTEEVRPERPRRSATEHAKQLQDHGEATEWKTENLAEQLSSSEQSWKMLSLRKGLYMSVQGCS